MPNKLPLQLNINILIFFTNFVSGRSLKKPGQQDTDPGLSGVSISLGWKCQSRFVALEAPILHDCSYVPKSITRSDSDVLVSCSLSLGKGCCVGRHHVAFWKNFLKKANNFIFYDMSPFPSESHLKDETRASEENFILLFCSALFARLLWLPMHELEP